MCQISPWLPLRPSLGYRWSFLTNSSPVVKNFFQGSPLLSQTRSGDGSSPCSCYILSLGVLWSHWWIPKFSVPSTPRSQRAPKHSWTDWPHHSRAPWPFLRHSLAVIGVGTQTCLQRSRGAGNWEGHTGVSVLLQQWADPRPHPEGNICCNMGRVIVITWLKTPKRQFWCHNKILGLNRVPKFVT